MSERRWVIDDEVSLIACYDATVLEVYRYASRLASNDRGLADDLVQDTYLRLVRAARGGDITEIGIGWLITTVRNRFCDGIRSAQREERRVRLAHRPDEATEPQVATDLSDLPQRERTALLLRYVDDLSVAEVAELMGTTVHATESLLARARRRVRAREVRDA